MSSMAIRQNFVAVAKGLQVDLYHLNKHSEILVPTKIQENDVISDITISYNCEHLALITLTSKQLVIYDLPLMQKYRICPLPRSASKIRFTANNEQVLVADKSGDVLIYNIKDEEPTGTKLLGHLSLLLDVLQTNDGKYVISSDRDEKIRVSCYPNTFQIQTYCLGHKEFVNHIELLPHNTSYLTSTSGDGLIKCWDYISGKLCYSIDTYQDVNDLTLKETFIKSMDSEKVEVETLPIVHYAVTKVDETSSLLIAAVYSYNQLLIYRLGTDNNKFSHKLIHKLGLERYPLSIACHDMQLFTYDHLESAVSIFNILQGDNSVVIRLDKKIKMFENISTPTNAIDNNSHEAIKVLYKRKFDNVQEYQERKRQRLEKFDNLNK